MKQIILVKEKIDVYNQQHRAIFEALKMRDPTTAADLIARHLETARQDLVGADSI
jgi:DNA-binding GntR family transcriptional regulator